jgi:hypothetical protein
MATVRQKPARRRRSESAERIVEQGDIFFAYRPRVEEAEVEGLRGVQRFFMVLKPRGRDLFRLAVLGRKHLPAADEHERIWGFVDEVEKSGGAIKAEFEGYRYRTSTRGKRSVAAARPAGEGVYALIQRGRNLHLIYKLELPRQPGEVQEEFNIAPQGAYILSIKNPNKPGPAGGGLASGEEAHYPKSLQREFADRRFATADPRLLDYEGAEFVLIGARTDPEQAYDIGIETEPGTVDIFRQLKMSRGEYRLEPLLKGEWR